MRIITPDTRAHAYYDWCSQRIAVRLFQNRGYSPVTRLIGAPVEMVEFNNDGRSQEPTFRLDPDAAQELMDALWDCGIRPGQAAGSAGQLDATQKHLDDMRAIAFAGLNIEKK